MRYLALASDYDGTLARDGHVNDSTVRAVERLIDSGRHFILVTGRLLSDLESVFLRLDLCERVVAENGAVLFHPASHEKRILAQQPPQSFVDDLRARGIRNLDVGDVIVATLRSYEAEVMKAIRASGLDLEVILNKESMMVLPSGTNKKTGLCAALVELALTAHSVAGVGDAENDQAFLEACGCAVAVSNAIPALKEKADWVTEGARGAGVAELIEKILNDELLGSAA